MPKFVLIPTVISEQKKTFFRKKFKETIQMSWWKNEELQAEIDLWKKIVQWQKKYFEFSRQILNRNFKKEEDLLDSWAQYFLSPESMNAGAVSIFLESGGNKNMLCSHVFKVRSCKDIGHPISFLFPLDDNPITRWFRTDLMKSLYIATVQEIEELQKIFNSWSMPPDIKIYHLLCLRISAGEKSIGIVCFFNQYRRSERCSDGTYSRVGEPA